MSWDTRQSRRRGEDAAFLAFLAEVEKEEVLPGTYDPDSDYVYELVAVMAHRVRFG